MGSNFQANINATFKFIKIVIGADLLKVKMTENEIPLSVKYCE